MGGKSAAPAPVKPPEPVVDDKATMTQAGPSAGAISAAVDEEKKKQGANNLGSTGNNEARTRRRNRDPGSAINSGAGGSLGASNVLTG